MVGDRTGVEGFQKIKGRLRIENLGLASIFEGKPDLSTVWRRGNVGAE
jgi:hypothetical protein